MIKVKSFVVFVIASLHFVSSLSITRGKAISELDNTMQKQFRHLKKRRMNGQFKGRRVFN